MQKQPCVAALVLALLISALAGTQLTSWVGANPMQAPPINTIYIRSDGSIEPSTAPIQRAGSVYSFLSDLTNSTIEVQCDNVVIDGKGFSLSGYGAQWYAGITLSNRRGVTVKNLYISQFGHDIKMDNAEQNSIIENRLESAMDGVKMINSNHNQISGNWISGVTYGVHGSGSFNQITANNFSGNAYSVRCWCDYNIISNNFFQDQTSVFLNGEDGCHYNTISGNTMQGSEDGVYLLGFSTNNMVFGNNITGKQKHGIYITHSWNNTIYGNHLANNRVGIQIGFDPSLHEYYPSSNTTFYHNNLLSNVENVRIERAQDGSLPSNHWDNGNEGNYWSDYLTRYPNASEIGNTGIGDTPYSIFMQDGSLIDQDHYPLMVPFDISSINLEFPEWEYTPPSLSPLPSLSPEPTPSTSPSPSPLPLQEPTSTPEPFPTTLVVATSGASVAVVGLGLLVYFKKRER